MLAHALAGPPRYTWDPRRTADAIRHELRCPALPWPVAYALLALPETAPRPLPVAFPTIDALCRGIHRRRGERPIQLMDCPLRLRREDEPRLGVSIWSLGESGDRQDYIAWAYVNGAGWRVLQAALFDIAPRLAA